MHHLSADSSLQRYQRLNCPAADCYSDERLSLSCFGLDLACYGGLSFSCVHASEYVRACARARAHTHTHTHSRARSKQSQTIKTEKFKTNKWKLAIGMHLRRDTFALGADLKDQNPHSGCHEQITRTGVNLSETDADSRRPTCTGA